MYILKIKGIKGKSDYIQIRDDKFTLIAYFSFNNLHKALTTAKLIGHEDEIKELISKAEYGKVIDYELKH